MPDRSSVPVGNRGQEFAQATRGPDLWCETRTKRAEQHFWVESLMSIRSDSQVSIRVVNV